MEVRKKMLAALSLTIIFCYSLVLLLRERMAEFLKEDGFFEWLTAIFFLVSSVAFFLLFFRPKFFHSLDLENIFDSKLRRYCFLILALILFFGFGEEISWGQRIIGFDTPEALASKNTQNEFNIHNLEIFDIKDVNGDRKDFRAKLFSAKQLFLYCFSFYLFVIPLLSKYFVGIDKLLRFFLIPIPAIWLGILFICNYVVYRLLRFTTDQLPDRDFMNHALTEMQEFNFSILLLVLPFLWFNYFGKKM